MCRYGSRRRGVGQEAAIWSEEVKMAVGFSHDRKTFLVNRAVVAAAERDEVRERRWSALRPMMDVVTLNEPGSADRKAATLIAMYQRTAQGWRNGPGSRSDLDGAPLRVVLHSHAAGVARQSLGRLRGNARPVLEHR